MKFGPVPVAEAAGAILAHSVRAGGLSLRKGVRLGEADIAALSTAGVGKIVAARLEAGDVHEDEAARRVASRLAGSGIRVDPPATGRCNLYAEQAGLFVVDRTAIDRLNRLDPGITVATLAAFAPVEAGRMVATVKIIPFAVPETAAAEAEGSGDRPLAVAAWRPLQVALVATVLPGLKPGVMDKTRRALEARLAPTGARLATERRVAHDRAALAEALASVRRGAAELIVAFGASAITDPDDVIPAAIRSAGGVVHHFGMPVDPGNLLLLGELDGAPVLGAPGCARSPAENGFDWILQRLLAGLPVAPSDITSLGVGGLLMEIVSRPQPREAKPAAATGVAALMLAAGRSSRMGGPNKLLARFEGEPLARRVAGAVLGSRAAPLIAVTGDRADDLRSALDGLPVSFVHNPDFRDGLATSLRAGIAAVPEDAAAVLVVLADMPGLTSAAIDAIVKRFHGTGGTAIVVATSGGRRGNPVLWPRRFFPELLALSGDAGARLVIAAHEDAVERVEIGEAAGLDVDTPEAVVAAGGELPEQQA